MRGKVAYFGLFVGLGLILGYVEALIPFFMSVPGVKLGLPNLIIVVALYKMGVREAYLLSVTRIVLSGFIFGNLFAILYSLSGGILSLFVMSLLKKRGDFSIIGVSVAGGVFHNIGQLITAVLVVETLSVSYYLSVLLISGLITGFLIGAAADQLLKRLASFHF